MHASDTPLWKGSLRQERIRRNWRQQDLAERIGTTVLTVQRWERGSHQPSAYFRVKLSVLFGESVEESGLLPESVPAPNYAAEVKAAPLVQATASSSSSPPLWSVPYPRNPFFTGREEILEILHERLHQEYTMALTQSWAVTGLGGIGKTQIALEYAYRYRQDYRFVFWTSAATRESLLADLASMADRLQLLRRDEQDQKEIILAVKQWLSTHQGWLWILDNADDVAMVYEFVPAERSGHLLFTSRAQALGPLAQRIEVETMGMVEGTLFLLHRARLLCPDAFLDAATEDQLARAETIVLEMDFLPLALDQAGAYIEEVGCDLAEYLALYRVHRADLLRRRGHIPTDHPASVATTWSLSFQKIEQANPASADLLRLCAFLEPDAIPEELISEGYKYLGPILGPVAANTLWLNEAIEELRKFSLIQRSPATKTLRIHRLVQAVFKDAMEERVRHQWAERAVQATNSVFPEHIEITTWLDCRRYLPQAQSCSVLIRDYALTGFEAASLLSRTDAYLQIYSLYQQAEPLEQQALSIREQTLGPDHPDVAISLNNLGLLYYEQGKYEQAEPLFQRAIHIQEQALGPEHLDIAISLRNLTFLYLAQEKYEQAESMSQRAVHIREQALGPDHPDTAGSLNNLAIIYEEQGKHEQAELLFQRAVYIREQALGPDHPDIALLLNNLAIIYYERRKYEQAELLTRRALCILEQAVGSDYTVIAHVLNGLANIYRTQGKYEQAEQLYQRALSLRTKDRPWHMDTADTLHDFAVFREIQGNLLEAVSLYQRALAIRERVFGLQHSKTTDTRARLHAALQALDQTEYRQS